MSPYCITRWICCEDGYQRVIQRKMVRGLLSPSRKCLILVLRGLLSPSRKCLILVLHWGTFGSRGVSKQVSWNRLCSKWHVIFTDMWPVCCQITNYNVGSMLYALQNHSRCTLLVEFSTLFLASIPLSNWRHQTRIRVRVLVSFEAKERVLSSGKLWQWPGIPDGQWRMIPKSPYTTIKC